MSRRGRTLFVVLQPSAVRRGKVFGRPENRPAPGQLLPWKLSRHSKSLVLRSGVCSSRKSLILLASGRMLARRASSINTALGFVPACRASGNRQVAEVEEASHSGLPPARADRAMFARTRPLPRDHPRRVTVSYCACFRFKNFGFHEYNYFLLILNFSAILWE